jgi:hypothetical protein
MAVALDDIDVFVVASGSGPEAKLARYIQSSSIDDNNTSNKNNHNTIVIVIVNVTIVIVIITIIIIVITGVVIITVIVIGFHPSPSLEHGNPCFDVGFTIVHGTQTRARCLTDNELKGTFKIWNRDFEWEMCMRVVYV